MTRAGARALSVPRVLPGRRRRPDRRARRRARSRPERAGPRPRPGARRARPFDGFLEAVPTPPLAARALRPGRAPASRPLARAPRRPRRARPRRRRRPRRLHEIAVRYGGEDGPDLDAVARGRGLTESGGRPAARGRGVHRLHARLPPGLRLPRAPAGGPRGPAPRDPPRPRAGGIRGRRGAADRRLPRRLARRLAAHRPHLAAPLRSVSRRARPLRPRRPRALRPGGGAAAARARGGGADALGARRSSRCSSPAC